MCGVVSAVMADRLPPEVYWKKRALDAEKKSSQKGAYQKKQPQQYQKVKKPKKASGNGPLSSLGGGLGGLAAGALFPEAGPLATAIGSFLGGKIGHLADKIVGFGDYQVQSNSIMRGGMTSPQIMNTVEKGGVVVRFREYVADIPATIAFASNVYFLNPGQRKSFPWLSTFAKNWQQYRWRGIIWEFGSTSSDAVLSSATSSALGTVNMATDYDVLDDDYTSKRDMLNTLFANSSKPSNSFIHPIECKRDQTPMAIQYVRTGNYPDRADPRMYDLGKFQIATEGMQAASGNVGELWVTYEVEFYKQQLGQSATTDMFALSTMTDAFMLGTAQPVQLEGSTLNGTIGSDGTNNYYEFPSYIANGKYLFQYSCFGVAATLGGPTITVTGGALTDLWNASALAIQSPAAGQSSTAIIISFIVEISASSCRVTFGTQVIPTVANTGNLVVTEIAIGLQDN